ncbi:MAG: hypothetical protein IKE40_00295, partial [Firmicutes bacterium]|nr:hypothetical protein [Bacillota bacterium]
MKRVLSWFLSILLVFSMSPVMSFAGDWTDQAPEISFVVDDSAVNTTGEASVTVTIGTSSPDVSSYAVGVEYDPAFFELDDTKGTTVDADEEPIGKGFDISCNGTRARTGVNTGNVDFNNNKVFYLVNANDKGFRNSTAPIVFTFYFKVVQSALNDGGTTTLKLANGVAGNTPLFQISNGEDEVLYPGGSKDVVINGLPDISLTGTIAQPVKNGSPSSTLSADKATVGDITWEPALTGNKFAANTAYTASFTLTPTEPVKGVACEDTSFTVSEPDSNGVYTVSKTFEKTAAKALSSIAVTTNPSKMSYSDGDVMDPTGMVLTATYDDDSTSVLSTDEYEFVYADTDYNKLTKGDDEVSIVPLADRSKAIGLTGIFVAGKEVNPDDFTFAQKTFEYAGDQTEAVAATITAPEGIDPSKVQYFFSKGSSFNPVAVKDAGTYAVFATVAGDKHYTDTNIAFGNDTKIQVTPKEVEVVWDDSTLTKDYNGQLQAPAASAAGVNGDVITLSIKVDGADGKKDAGDYSASASIESVSNGDNTVETTNYTLKTETTTAAFKIKPRELEFTQLNVKSKTYDGTTTAELNLPNPLPGVVSGDDVSLNATAAFEDKNFGLSKKVNITNMALTGADAKNYTLKSTTAESWAAISRRQVGAEWDQTSAQNLVYDGTEKTVTANIIAVLSDGLAVVSGDVVELICSGNVNTNAGEYTAKVESLDGTDAGNYSLVMTPQLSYEIAKADLTDVQAAPQYLRSDEVQTGSYDYTFNLSDVIQFAGLPENAGTFNYSEPAVVGTADYIAANSLKIENGKLKFTVNPAQAKNTELTINVKVSGQNYNDKTVPIKFTFMSKKDVSEQLALTIENALDPNASLIYGDEFIVTGTYTNGDNAVASDVTASCVYKQGDTTLEGVPTDAGTYTAVWTYEDIVEDGAFPGHLGTVEKEFTINPRPADVNWSNTELTYKGQPQKPTAKVTVLASDDGEIVADVSGEQTDAGDNYTATASITNTNYALTDNTKTTSFSIAKKPVTVSGIKADNREYDATTSATVYFTDVQFDGIVSPDELGVEATGEFADANAGENKTVTIKDLKLTGDAAKNYVLAESGQQTRTTANITPKEVSLTWKVPEDLVYNGEIKSVTATAGGLINSDTCDVIVADGAKINVGEYTARATGLSNANYKL